MHANVWTAALAGVTMTLLGGCGVKGGWMGADAEKAYEAQMKAKAEAAKLNNDDYYEIHRDGRIYVFSDLDEYQSFRKVGEIPLVVTKIGAGPNGETVKMGLLKSEAKAMEKTVGYKGSAQRMFEGELKGADKGFYGELHKNGRIYVFTDWKDLEAFKATGEAPFGVTHIGKGPNRETVVFVQNSASAKSAPTEAIARFESIYAAK
ncbi:hypothetical protein SAMN04488120_102249 [Fontimonas thermophila]|uniref:Uncharacterized protein n=1 Tax=Fontimonas thermophila TaxID=1076937 RepID=A0A1I2HVX4_9GAMM|nr:hypothetical protein [Fontimonas thermophila]SFF33573.1 hypothetical protein SAMN04488120_102249 [Fontimonas thermophila]